MELNTGRLEAASWTQPSPFANSAEEQRRRAPRRHKARPQALDQEVDLAPVLAKDESLNETTGTEEEPQRHCLDDLA